LGIDFANSNSDLSSSSKFRSYGRRMFIKALTGIGFLASFASTLLAYFVAKLGIRTVEKETFLFESDSGNVFWKARNKREPYLLIVDGLVENALKLPYSTLMKVPQISQTSDFHCVEGWSVKDISWGGIRFGEIVKIAQPAAEAKYVVFHSLGETDSAPQGQHHYIECLSVQNLLNPQKECLLALTMNGKALPQDHGAPMRIIAPYDLGYKSIKFICRIEFVKEEIPGWWTLANPIYPMHAPVPESRLRRK
jgi:DMSO/TMAO reductase YedYZ molybdopterin-dependent catalytic subunit